MSGEEDGKKVHAKDVSKWAKVVIGVVLLALCVLFNYAKVKFTTCEPRPAKFYLILNVGELQD